ncbi:MAG: iron-containing alcohol dehydrogenase family protein [Chitinophagales bacterium]
MKPFSFYLGTRVFFGRNCLQENQEQLLKLGNKALIVTGRTSGKSSGALDDVIASLNNQQINYIIYDAIENNPTLENIKRAVGQAMPFQPQFVIAIGGGSPLDAAKAIAVLLTNEIDPLELFQNQFSNPPLPIAAIPTTAGTGSEVTHYSILTRKDLQTKMSFGNDMTFPRIAFVDPAYTASMPYEVAVDTALDALSHAIEGYLSKRSTLVGDILALEAIKLFGECVSFLQSRNLDYQTREKLLYLSTLAGMVITQSGTTLVHGLGYSLTYFKDLPHGRANGLLLHEYLKYNYSHSAEKINNILKALLISDIDTFGQVIEVLLPNGLVLSDDEIEQFANLAITQKNTQSNLKPVSIEDLKQILRDSQRPPK